MHDEHCKTGSTLASRLAPWPPRAHSLLYGALEYAVMVSRCLPARPVTSRPFHRRSHWSWCAGPAAFERLPLLALAGRAFGEARVAPRVQLSGALPRETKQTRVAQDGLGLLSKTPSRHRDALISGYQASGRCNAPPPHGMHPARPTAADGPRRAALTLTSADRGTLRAAPRPTCWPRPAGTPLSPGPPGRLGPGRAHGEPPVDATSRERPPALQHALSRTH